MADMAEITSMGISELLSLVIPGSKDVKLESFGYFLADYVIDGAVVTADQYNKRKVTLSEGILSFASGLYRVYAKEFFVSQPNTTYYLDFSAKGITFNVTHPAGDYLPLWQVNTTSAGFVQTVVDMRGEMGYVRFKEEIVGIIPDNLFVDETRIRLDFPTAELKARLDNIVSNAGDSNTEIVDARDASPTLRERLDTDRKNLTEQIVSVVSDIDDIKSGKADLSYTNTQLSNKRDKSIAIEMADLSTAVKTSMTGGSVAVVGEKAVGQENYKERSLTPNIPTFFKEVLNLFNHLTAVSGFDINSSGNLAANASYFASDYIEISPSLEYKILNFESANNFANVAYYTSDKTFISRISGTAPFTTPASAKYLRFSSNASKTGITLSLSTANILKYEPYLKAYFDESFLPVLGGSQLTNKTITPIKTVFFGNQLNLYNKDAAVDGSQINVASGGTVTNATFSRTDYIEVTGSTQYISNEYTQIAWYDKLKKFISGSEQGSKVVVTSPATAAYMRFSIPGSTTDKKNGLMFTEGGVLPNEYKSFGTVYFDPKYFDPLMLSSNKFGALKWNSLGDSVTAANKYQTFANLKLGFNTVRNYGIAGTCIALKADGSNAADAFVRRYTAMDNDADVITVMGGTNDWGNSIPIGSEDVLDEKTLLGAIAIIIEGLIVKYPGKYIVWATLPQRNSGYETTGRNANGDSTADYAEAIKRVCKKYGIPCIDVHNESGINKFNMDTNGTLMPDKIHPSDAGYKRIAPLFIDMFNKVVY